MKSYLSEQDWANHAVVKHTGTLDKVQKNAK